MTPKLQARLWMLRYKLRGRLPWLYEPIYTLIRRLQGARRPPIRGYEATAGELDADGIRMHWGGACPVQGEGEIDGHPVYYRSRGETWTAEFFAPGTDISEDLDGEVVFETYHRDYINYDGGWIAAEETVRNLTQAAQEFRACQRRSALE